MAKVHFALVNRFCPNLVQRVQGRDVLDPYALVTVLAFESMTVMPNYD